MKRKRWLGVVGAVGVAAAVTSCNGGDHTYIQGLKPYLAKSGALNSWLETLGDAVCDLEKNVTGLDPTKLYCTGPGPGDKKPPPSYPP